MKTVMRFTLAVLTIGAMLGMSGCTDLSSRNTLTVDSVNGGNAYFSDVYNNLDPLKPYIPVDQVKVVLGIAPVKQGTEEVATFRTAVGPPSRRAHRSRRSS